MRNVERTLRPLWILGLAAATHCAVCSFVYAQPDAAAPPPMQDLTDDIFNQPDTGTATPPTGRSGTFTGPTDETGQEEAAPTRYQPTPEEIEALQRGQALFRDEKYKEAAREFAKAIQNNDGQYVEATYWFGRTQNKLENFARAASSLQRAGEEDVKLLEDQQFLYELAYAQAFAGLSGQPTLAQEAINNIDKALRLHGADDWADAFYVRGAAHKALADVGAEEDYAQAYDDLHKAIELDDARKEYHLQLGLIQYADEKYEPAVQSLSRAIELAGDEGYTQALVSRSAVRITMGKLEKDAGKRSSLLRQAIDDCKESAALAEEEFASYFNRGLAHRYLDEYDLAIQYFTEAARRAPGYSETYLRRGIVWYYLGDFGQAAADFDYAITVSKGERTPSGDPRVLHWRGLTYARTGNFARAIMTYNALLAENPTFPDAHLNRGLAYLQLADYATAIEALNTYIRLDPLKAKGFYYRGVAQARMGARDEARQSLERAVKLDPHDAPARGLLDRLSAAGY